MFKFVAISWSNFQMMRFKTLLLTSAVMLLSYLHSNGQIPDGSIAPDFTLTDINGNTHHLYDYLAQGKVVVLDFSATWCSPCWSYHNSGALENLYNQYGPNGTDQFMVFFIEADLSTNMDDLLGNTGSSQGNWIDGTPYPIIDLQSGAVSNAYQIGYYPTIFTICPSDYTVYESGQVTTASHATWLQSCALDVSLDATTEAICYGDGTATLAVSGGLTPLQYQWSNGSSDADLQGVGGGTYAVTVTEGNGKRSVLEDIVIGGPLEDVLITNTLLENNGCFGDASGQIEVSVSGGTPGYQYDWSSSNDPGFSGNGTGQIAQLPAGSYTLDLTDANGCQYSEVYEVTEPPLLEASLLSVSAEACNQVNGVIEFLTSGGTGIVTATIDGPSGTFTTTDNFVDNLLAGTYTIDLADQNGCSTALTATIEYLEAPTVEVISDNILTCTEPVLQLEAQVNGQTGDIEYNWTTSSGNILTFNDLSEISVDAPGEYFVEITDLVTGCTADNSILVISDQDIPAVDLSASGDLDCSNSEVTIEASFNASQPDLVMIWMDQSGNIIASDVTQITVTQGGVYSFSLSNPDNGCATMENILVIDQSVDVVPAFNFQVTELSAFFEDLSTGNVNNWSWDFGDGNSSVEENPAHIYAADGIYTVCLTVMNGCASETVCQEVTVQADVTAILVNHNATDNICFGGADGSVDLNVVGGTGGYTYQWSGPNGFESADQNISGLPAGIYEVLITDSEGNSVSYSIEIFEPQPLELQATELIMVGCFGGQDGQISVEANGGTPPYSYLWTNGATSEAIAQLVPGTYGVLVTDANGCQVDMVNYVIEEPEPVVVDAVVQDILCFGDQDGQITLETSGGTPPYSYAWTNGATAGTIEQLPPGTYGVMVTDANGCQYEIDNFVIDEPSPVVVETNVFELLCFGDESGIITTDVSGGTTPYTYMWSTGTQDPGIENVVAGTYAVTVSDANGCVAVSEDLQVNEPPIIQINSISIVHASASSANDGNIDIEVIGGVPPYTYTWSNGETSEDLEAVEPGVYSVIVTDANGCVFTSSGIEVSFSTGIEDLEFSRAIAVSPNPARGLARISWTFEMGTDMTIEVCDAIGRRVGQTEIIERSVAGNLAIDVSGWDAGLYLISVKSEDKVAIKKLMVE